MRHLIVIICLLFPMVNVGIALQSASAHALESRHIQDNLDAANATKGPSIANSNKYQISYVESDRRWRYGLRSEPYNKISKYIQDLLVEKLGKQGLVHADAAEGTGSKIVIELLEVTSHPAMFKKPGMDVAATISVVDSRGEQVYAKGYRGESRTMMNTYGHLIDHAAGDLVEHAANDPALLRSLGTPQVSVAGR